MKTWKFAAHVLGLLGLATAVSGQCGRWLPGDAIAGVNGTVLSVTTWDPDGDGPSGPWLVVGGVFSVAGAEFAANVAAWDGAQWRALGAGLGIPATQGVYALVSHNGQLFATGNFDRSGGTVLTGMARWDGARWQPELGGQCECFAVHNGELYAGRSSGGIGRRRDGS